MKVRFSGCTVKKGGTVKAGEYNFNGKETKFINLEQDISTPQNSVRK